MIKCTNPLGHFPDNQGYCHECGVGMSEAYKDFSRDQIIECLFDMAMAITSEIDEGSKAYPTRAMYIANEIFTSDIRGK